MKFSKIVFLLPVLFVLGCSTESTKNKNVGFNEPDRFDGEGNFRVKTIAADAPINVAYNDYKIVTKKQFHFKACLTDPLGVALQAGLPFVIQDNMGGEKTELTDSNGCLIWPESHSYRQIDDEAYIKIKRKITSQNFYSGYVNVTFGLNPWSDSPGAVIDLRYKPELPPGVQVLEMDQLSIQGQTLRSTESPNIQLNVESVSFDFLGLDYSNFEITPYLGLRVAHKYQYRLSPSLLRTAINKRSVPEVLNSGRLKVILVVLKEDTDPKTQYMPENVIASEEFEGQLIAGKLSGVTSVRFNSIANIMSRTIGLLTLIPLDELQGFPRVSFVGSLPPGLWKNLNLMPANRDALTLHLQYQTNQREMRRQVVKPVELFAKHSGFKPIAAISDRVDLGAIAEKVIHKNSLSPSDKKSLDYHLCESLFGQKQETKNLLRQCRYRPSALLNFQVKAFAEKILTPVPKHIPVLTTSDEFKMTSSFSISETSSLNAGYNVKGGVNVGFNLGGGNNRDYIEKDSPLSAKGWSAKQGLTAGLNFSVGADMAYSQVWKKDESVGVSASRGQTVVAEGNVYRFNATVRRCLVVTPNSERVSNLGDIASEMGRFYCSKLTTDETREEVYYLVNTKFGADGSVVSDNASNGSSPWRMMVRGVAMKNFFQELATAGFFEFVLMPFKGMKTQDQYLNQFKELHAVANSNQTEVFPGLLSE